MNVAEKFGERFGESIGLAALTVFSSVFANTLSRTIAIDEISIMLILSLLTNLGGVVLLINLVIATWRAGLFGTLGVLLEFLATVNIQNGELYFGVLIIGILLVIIGRLIWSWSVVIRIFSEAQGNSYRGRRRR